MLKNYLKTAWRNLRKSTFYSLINIAGLTAALTVGILILLWVQDELSFDRFHTKADAIYRLENRVGTGNSVQIWEQTASPIGRLAKEQLPAVKEVVRMSRNFDYTVFKYGDNVFQEDKVSYTDPSLFTLFDFPLVKGNIKQPFTDIYSVILTETAAKRYFGDGNPIGKVIVADNKTNFTVSAVVRDFPANSSIHQDMFMPMALLAKTHYEQGDRGYSFENDFHEFNYDTYLQLQPSTNLVKLADELKTIHLHNKADDTDIKYLVQPLTAMHLYRADGTEAGIESVRLFIIIALLILIIGCINYVNLSTARSLLRAREISLRKIIGAVRFHLFLQFVVETALLFAFSAVLAIICIYLLMPMFNSLSGKQLSLDISNADLWKIMGAAIFGTLLLSSIYPAVLLSSFEPLKALKGKISSRVNDAIFRKVLVVIQFTFSVALIAGTFIIHKQMNFVHSKKLGYDKENVFGMSMRDMRQHYDVVKNELLQQPGVINVTRAGGNIVNIGMQTGNNFWDGKQEGETMMVRPMAIDSGFISFFDLQLRAGKPFTAVPADSTHFILNETAVKTAGIKDPIGKKFKLWDREGTIIGVVNDFHLASMKSKIEPVVFYYSPESMWALYIKTTGKDAQAAIAAAGQQWKKYNPDFAFDWFFLDDVYNNLYESEQQTSHLFEIFALVAIIISCLGLLGLTTYMARVRAREIGVRKVLGATVHGIIGLIAIDFIKLIFVAIGIATPLAWFVMHKWLQGFAYQTEVGWLLFVLAGLTALFISLITIGYQALKAATVNPVKSLRSE